MARSRTLRQGGALSRNRIEEAALDLIEREGLEAFSTRKLAAELGCEAMSIYHYYPSKAHLLDGLFDRVIGALPAGDPAQPWRQRLEAAVLAYRAMGHRYPRFFQFIALHRHNTGIGLAWLERTLSILVDEGLDTEAAARSFRIVSYYAVGGILDETSGYARGQSAVAPVPDADAEARFPRVAAVNRYFKPAEHEATFRLGLDTLLDRIEAEIAGVGRGRAPPDADATAGVRPDAPRARSSRSSSR